MKDPLAQLQRSRRHIAAVSAIVAAGAGVWAFRPVSGAVVRTLQATSPQNSVVGNDTAQIRSELFAVKLWAPPVKPPPPPSPVTPPTPPPMKLQLLAILKTTSDSTGTAGPFNAMLFDPDADKLVTLGAGGTIGPFTVRSVESRRVEIAQGEFTYSLTLATAGEGR